LNRGSPEIELRAAVHRVVGALGHFEVTPSFIRLRKVELAGQKRQTAASRKARCLATV
jgi:predicted membrane GTPase involved in stress response